MSNSLGLCSPWIDFYKKINALFEKDPEVKVNFDQDKYEIQLFVDNVIKADALTKLLPTERKYGEVVVKIVVIPADNREESRIDLFRNAFQGNPAVDLITSAGPLGYDFQIRYSGNELIVWGPSSGNMILQMLMDISPCFIRQ